MDPVAEDRPREFGNGRWLKWQRRIVITAFALQQDIVQRLCIEGYALSSTPRRTYSDVLTSFLSGYYVMLRRLVECLIICV